MGEEEEKREEEIPEDLPSQKEDVVEEDVVDKKSKDYLLGGKPPLRTILDLSSGPVVSQTINALYGIVTTFYISIAVHQDGLSAISTYAIFDSVGRSFGFFLSTAASVEIAALFGKGKDEETHQLAADIFRTVILFGILVPCILIPCLKPAARWFGASQNIVDLGFIYIAPLSGCAIFSILYTAIGGILMAEGRTGIASLTMIIALILNMGVFGPAFLFGAKLGMLGAALATILSEFIVGIIFTVLYFMGKFTVKPTLKMLISKPSPYIGIAVKLGLSTLFGQLSGMVPAIIVRKIIGMACTPTIYDPVMAAYICSFRYQAIVIAIIQALQQALVPSASYAYQARRYNRFLWLVIHTIWINLIWGAICSIIMYAIPRQLASLFGEGEDFLHYGAQAISTVNGLSFTIFVKYIGVSLLQSIQKPWFSMLTSLINNLITIIVFAYIMYYTDKTNPIRIMWCYTLSYCMGIVVSTSVCAKPVYTIYKQSKEEEKVPPGGVAGQVGTAENSQSSSVGQNEDEVDTVQEL